MIFGVETIFNVEALSIVICVIMSIVGRLIGKGIHHHIAKEVTHPDPKVMFKMSHHITECFGGLFQFFAAGMILITSRETLTPMVVNVLIGVGLWGITLFFWYKWKSLALRGVSGWIVKG